MASVIARAPAKINLQLSVGAHRADGFHELATVFHAVSLYDDVTATPADSLGVSLGSEAGISLVGVPRDESNLAASAALLLAEHTGRAADVHLLVRKGIPVAGGMAGGSADAAAALVACDALWGTGLARSELHQLATRLGSDVPFALMEAQPSAWAAASTSPPHWPAVASSGCWPSPTVGCPRRPSTPSVIACAAAGCCPSRAWPTT